MTIMNTQLATGYRLPATGPSARRLVSAIGVALLALVSARDASAQLDPLLFLKRTKPNVLIAVDTSNPMQRDANDDYLDANIYTRTGASWEGGLNGLAVTDANTVLKYRRKYINLLHTDPVANAGDKFSADSIAIVGDLEAGYLTFDERTRLSVARRAIIAAITANQNVARFGLLKLRQSNPVLGAEKNEGPVKVSLGTQQTDT